MKKLIIILLGSLLIPQLTAQTWQELYDSTYDCWDSDWETCAEILEKALVAAKEEFGEMDSAYALTINDLGLCYVELRSYQKAETSFQKSLWVIDSIKGKDHVDYGTTLYNLSELYFEIGNYPKSLETMQESLINQGKNLGKDHLDYAVALMKISQIHHKMGNYQEALKTSHQALDKLGTHQGKGHPEYGSCLNKLGLLYKEVANYPKALEYLQMALEVTRNNRETFPFYYSTTLNDLNLVYQDLRDFEKALQLALETLEWHRSKFGENNRASIQFMHNLALLYGRMGNYEKALPLFIKTMNLEERLLGTEHPNFGYTLNNLADIYKNIGAYEQALPLAQRALEHTEKTLGKDHMLYGARLRNLGSLYFDLGDDVSAIPLFKDALKNLENSVGKEHHDYTITLNNLGLAYERSGDYSKALALYQEALKINEIIFGKEHLFAATNLHNIGHLYARKGDYDLALSFYQKAIDNVLKSSGPDNKRYGAWANNLGQLYEKANEQDKAVIAYLNSNKSNISQIQIHFTTLSEELQSIFLQDLTPRFNHLSSSMLNIPQADSLIPISFNNQLLLKGLLMENKSRLQKSIKRTQDDETQEIYDRWEFTLRHLALEYQKPLSQRSHSFDSLQNEAQELEVLLSERSLDFQAVRTRINWQDIKAELGPSEASIEFAHFPYSQKGNISTDSIMYVAFVLRSSSPTPKMVPLFEEKEFAQLLNTKSNQDNFDQLYTYRGVKPRKNPNFQNLSKILWNPIDSLLEGINTIYYSPSGLLNRINFDAIPLDKKTLLSDKYQLVQLGSTRSLAFRNNTLDQSQNMDAVLLGGIEYDVNIPEEPLISENLVETSNLGLMAISSRGNTARWTYLPGTSDEVDNIQELLTGNGYEVTMKKGSEASESYIRKLDTSPRILHIATHGYFFPDPKDTTARDASKNLPPIQLSEHPMIRSGLILAGANPAWQGKSLPEGQEDGILTAYEISRMDLSNTELVVLSACETGLGDIEGNEGVYGLQRAFKIAGAKYILMSLWQVPDAATQELMTIFYREWTGGKPIREALKEAQSQIRQKYKKPYYWAGFVLVE